jgi:hypothetical protein
MQAIQCKYLSATNSRGSRIKATCASGSITIGYPHELSGQAVFRAAADALVIKMNWQDDNCGELLGGQLPDNSYVFVFNNNASKE